MTARARTQPSIAAVLIGMTLAAWPVIGRCWGEEGHQIIGLIALHYLEPKVRMRADELLAGDTSGLTGTDMADETVWADRFRDSDRNTTRHHYTETFQWHFVDVELAQPNLDSACFAHPPLPPGTVASEGPAADCIVDKIEQFRAELGSAGTPLAERRLALQFLLHLVGDLHQPLHAADDHDRGGNDLRVVMATERAGNLHHYWDTVFVAELGPRSDIVAARLIADLSERQRHAYAGGSVADWAWETFDVARSHAYGRLPRPTHGILMIDDTYAADARHITEVQLQRAGVRLAQVLNAALR